MRLTSALFFTAQPLSNEISAFLTEQAITFQRSHTSEAARNTGAAHKFDAILIEHRPESRVQDLVRQLRSARVQNSVIAIVQEAEKRMTGELIAAGATDVLIAPITPDTLLLAFQRASAHQTLSSEIDFYRAQVANFTDELVGRSEHIRKVFRDLDHYSATLDPVLISGDHGTGKKLVALNLHARSPRARGTFVKVDCGAYPGSLLEQELFGSENDASFGRKTGMLELADGGTLVLDRVEMMSIPVQERLVELIEKRQFTRKGSEIKVNVRLIGLTGAKLEARLADGSFKPEFHGKFAASHIQLLPLSQRENDAALICEYFYRRYCTEMGIPSSNLEMGFSEAVAAYNWPGNISELMGCMKRAAYLSGAQQPLTAAALGIGATSGTAVVASTGVSEVRMPSVAPAAANVDLSDSLVFKVGTPISDVELEMIRRTVDLTRGNRTKAAKMQGISVRSVYSKLLEIEQMMAKRGLTTGAPVMEESTAECA